MLIVGRVHMGEGKRYMGNLCIFCSIAENQHLKREKEIEREREVT